MDAQALMPTPDSVRSRSTSSTRNYRSSKSFKYEINVMEDTNRRKRKRKSSPRGIPKSWIFLIFLICVISLCLFVVLNVALFKTRVHEQTSSKTTFTANDIKAMATPFPNHQDFLNSNTTHGLPPFKIDIVFNYGGYRTDIGSGGIHVRDHGELQYSLRSIYWNIPWFNNIYIICPDELALNLSHSHLWPQWLNPNIFMDFVTPSNGKHHSIQFVPQSSLIYFNKQNANGNTNSNAFEINMHRIPHLTEHFILFCDDFFVGRPLSWKYFFINDGRSDYYKPRFALSAFLKYFLINDDSNYRNYSKYPTTYDCAIYEVEPQWMQYKDRLHTVIPSRVEKYYSHQPRPMTKLILNQFIGKYPKWFEFVESHKTRYCCPNPPKKYMCDRQENLWLTLYKQYIDFEIDIDIMGHPTKDTYIKKLPYLVSERDLIGYYHPPFSMKHKLERLMEIKPYTFSINDYYSSDLALHLKEFITFHNFSNSYWRNAAIFENQFENKQEIPWRKMAKDIANQIVQKGIENNYGFVRTMWGYLCEKSKSFSVHVCAV